MIPWFFTIAIEKMSWCSLWGAQALLTLTGQCIEVVFPQQSRGSNQKSCRQSDKLENRVVRVITHSLWLPNQWESFENIARLLHTLCTKTWSQNWSSVWKRWFFEVPDLLPGLLVASTRLLGKNYLKTLSCECQEGLSTPQRASSHFFNSYSEKPRNHVQS